jgi:ABC-type amino acid transport substrate-binding protein/predicted Ser/Thr protein kinase
VDSTPFGRYELRGLIGKGGMGEVYQAYDTRTDRIVALKVLPQNMAADVTFQERFRRESQAAAGLTEPHVVPIHSFGEIDGRLYLDMRLIEGRNLGSVLKETKRQPGTAFAVSVVEQVAAALDAAHLAGLIHRDVKPSNILVTPNDFVYLIDFGLARGAGDVGLTTAGNTLGTLAYMAPERFDGGKADFRSDIYALTCVLYECLTGSRPYPADSLEQQIAGHMTKPAPRPSAIDPRFAAFDDVIAKGMAKSPEKRYQTAGELAAAARRAMKAPVRSGASGRHTARRSPQAARRRMSTRWIAVAAAVALVVAVSAFAAWKWWPGGGRGTSSVSLPAGAVESIALTVPSGLRDAGQLVIAVNLPYAPNEFRTSDNKLVGFDVDLMNAVTKTLGLRAEYKEVAEFDTILGLVAKGDFDLGTSSFTDTKQRQETVDFVDYFETGTLWAQQRGSSVDPNAACGLRVGVTKGAVQDTTEIPAKNDQCVAAGLAPIDKTVYDRQDDLTKALIAGEVDAMSADSPVTLFTIKGSAGALMQAGDVSDTALYGWPVAKDSPLTEPLRQALQHVMETGEYKTIAAKWGVEKGMLDKPMINGGAS